MTAPILIATAGHVDHGKSTLVRCLTGTDPDRWEAEKKRGITIDLGYAHLTENDRTWSFVDVPGHEKFIHNMLAGIGSIDAVLFVIAADESIMPQTREHARALNYLGVNQVHVVLTKIDLVSEDLLELLHLEVDEFLEEYGWPEAKKVGFSSKQAETKTAVLELLGTLKKNKPTHEGGFRLSIDRVFSSPGSGTVLTGTVDQGEIHGDSRVTLLPSREEARIRQIQLHGETVDSVGSHMRAALNLGGIHYKSLSRGNLVFSGAIPSLSRKILVRLHCFEDSWTPSTKHHFHLHHLAAKIKARMLWQQQDMAAIELAEPYSFWGLDKGLVRDGSPLRVCAGFQVLDPCLTRVKKRRVLPNLTPFHPEGGLADWQIWYLNLNGGMIEAETLEQRCGMGSLPQVKAQVVLVGEKLILGSAFWERSKEQFLAAFQTCHKTMPLFETLPLNRVHNLLSEKNWPPPLIQELFKWAVETKQVSLSQDRARLAEHRPKWTQKDRKLLDEFLAQREQGISIFDRRTYKSRHNEFSSLESLLVWEQFLINLTPDLMIHWEFLNHIMKTLVSKYHQQQFAVGDLKTEFQFTRKFAIPLLEYFDKQGCTRREEEGRVWIASDPPFINCTWKKPE